MRLVKVFGLALLTNVISQACFAFDDGFYKVVQQNGTCAVSYDVSVYVEGDKPINLSIYPLGTAITQNPVKISGNKSKMTVRGEASVYEMEFCKIKNNQFNMKVLSGTSCDGLQLTFSKSS